MNKQYIYVGAIIIVIILAYVIGTKSANNVPTDGSDQTASSTAATKPTASKPSATKPTTRPPTTQVPVQTSLPATLSLVLNEKRSFSSITINPWNLMEDSRCPIGLQCVAAGKAKVATTIKGPDESFTKEFEIGDSVKVGAFKVTLKDVTPYPTANVTIADYQYRFIFEITKF